MSTTEQLERETEATRAQLARTLDELKSMTPGRVVDEVLDYAKDGGSDFLRGAKHQIAQHPLPATLIAAGIVWMMMENKAHANAKLSRRHAGADAWRNDPSMNPDWETRASSDWTERGVQANPGWNGSSGDTGDGWSDKASSALHGVKDGVQSAAGAIAHGVQSAAGAVSHAAGAMSGAMGHAAGAMGHGVQSAAGTVSYAAGSTASTMRGAASTAYGSVSHKAGRTADAMKSAASTVRDSTTALGQSAWEGSRGVLDFVKDQPLVLAGLGLAIGAALGASVPETQTENRLMGEAADAVKQKARAVASQEMDVAKTAGQHIMEEAKSAGQNLFEQAKTAGKQLVDETAEVAKQEMARVMDSPRQADQSGQTPSDRTQGFSAATGVDATRPADDGQKSGDGDRSTTRTSQWH